MKILIIGNNISKPYLGPSAVLNNTLKGFYKIDKKLEKYGVKITFLSLNDNINKKFSKYIRVISYRTYPPITFTGELQAVVNKPKETFDIVHAHGIYDLFPYVFSNTPTIFTLHGIFWKEIFFKSKLYSKLYLKLGELRLRFYYPKITRFVAISPYVIEELEAMGFDIKKAVVIENPVSDEFFEIEKEQDDMILYPAALKAIKNQLGFLKAFASVKNELKGYKLVFAGSGDSGYYATLRHFAEKHGLNAAFLGKVPYKEMVRLYSRASFVALTSFQETLPMAVLESLASGTPVLASRVGGLPYVIEDNINGLLVNPFNHREIAEKIIALTDKSLREKLAANAKRTAEKYRSDVVAKKLLELYLSCG